jgi:hypothetical protein
MQSCEVQQRPLLVGDDWHEPIALLRFGAADVNTRLNIVAITRKIFATCGV